MSRAWVAGIALFVAAVLQVSIAPHLAVLGVAPNFILLVVVTLALVEGPVAGCAAGFAGGLVFDLLGAGPLGPAALVLCVVGYLAGTLHAAMFAEGWLLPVTVVLVASLVAELGYGVLLAVLGQASGFGVAFVHVMAPSAVYNTALAFLFYPWLARLFSRDRSMTELRRLA